MRIIGCDLLARQQTVAMLDILSGEVVNRTLTHDGDNVREFYSTLPRPVCVGIEATGSMQWFVNLLEVGDLSPNTKNCRVSSSFLSHTLFPSLDCYRNLVWSMPRKLLTFGPNLKQRFVLQLSKWSMRSQSFRELAEFMVSSLKRIPFPEYNAALGA